MKSVEPTKRQRMLRHRVTMSRPDLSSGLEWLRLCVPVQLEDVSFHSEVVERLEERLVPRDVRGVVCQSGSYLLTPILVRRRIYIVSPPLGQVVNDEESCRKSRRRTRRDPDIEKGPDTRYTRSEMRRFLVVSSGPKSRRNPDRGRCRVRFVIRPPS